MALAQLNGTSIWYAEEGSGPPCLVLHGGLGIDHTLYRRTLAPLAERLHLVYPDHRGNGRSGRPPLGTITIEQLADDAAALVEHLGYRGVLVLGHSFGGFVAQELACRHPDVVSALVLVGTTPGQLGTDESPDDEQGPPPPPELVELLSAEPSTDAELATVMRALFHFYLHRADPADLEWAIEGTTFDVAAMTAGFESLGRWSAVDRLHGVAAPTLVVVGRHDVVSSWPQALRITRRVPGAELVVFEDSGHFPWLDEPARFAEVLGRWLDRSLPPA